MAAFEDWTSAELLIRLARGEEPAAEQLFQRYAERLTLLARVRLSSRLAGKLDPEDVTLSAWRSFFVGVRRGQFTLKARGDLWRLLVSIALHKLYRQVRHHKAGRRSIALEQPLDRTPEDLLRSADPSASEALALAEELESVMANLDAGSRRILELRLQGEQIATIAELTSRSERTVRRMLAAIRVAIAARFELQVDRKIEDEKNAEPHSDIDRPPSLPAAIEDADTYVDHRDFLL